PAECVLSKLALLLLTNPPMSTLSRENCSYFLLSTARLPFQVVACPRLRRNSPCANVFFRRSPSSLFSPWPDAAHRALHRAHPTQPPLQPLQRLHAYPQQRSARLASPAPSAQERPSGRCYMLA